MSRGLIVTEEWLREAVRSGRVKVSAETAVPAAEHPVKNKYGAKKVELDGFVFDSKREAKRYNELKLAFNAGSIWGLRIHPAFEIKINGIHVCDVQLDFAYWTKREIDSEVHTIQVFEDVKGRDNALSRLKRKLLEAYSAIKVEIVR